MGLLTDNPRGLVVGERYTYWTQGGGASDAEFLGYFPPVPGAAVGGYHFKLRNSLGEVTEEFLSVPGASLGAVYHVESGAFVVSHPQPYEPGVS